MNVHPSLKADHLELPWEDAFPGERFERAESPFWHPVEDCLYWVDIPGKQICRGVPGQKAVERWAMPSEPGCIAPAQTGGLVVALRDGFYRARRWGGALELLAQVAHPAPRMRFNDGKCDAQGRFWAGSIYEPKGQAIAALYRLEMQQGRAEVRQVLGGVATANGLAWSPDASTLYWADTPSHCIRAWAIDGRTGLPTGEPRLFARFAGKPPDGESVNAAAYGGRPDGATVDAQGHYLAAMFEGGCLQRLHPDGQVMQFLPVPVACPTMPALGGADGRQLFVTTARRGRPDARWQAQPLAGAILCSASPFQGRPTAFFHG